MNLNILYARLGIVFLVQTGHYAEHVTQLIQIYSQHVTPAQAHGLLGTLFDFEWVHFVYNVGLEIMVIVLWLAYRRRWRTAPPAVPWGPTLLTSLMLFQGYHSIEHIVKVYQYLFVPTYQTGLWVPPGILPYLSGWPIFLVHFWLNTPVWFALLAALWFLRPKQPTRRRATLEV